MALTNRVNPPAPSGINFLVYVQNGVSRATGPVNVEFQVGGVWLSPEVLLADGESVSANQLLVKTYHHATLPTGVRLQASYTTPSWQILKMWISMGCTMVYGEDPAGYTQENSNDDGSLYWLPAGPGIAANKNADIQYMGFPSNQRTMRGAPLPRASDGGARLIG